MNKSMIIGTMLLAGCATAPTAQQDAAMRRDTIREVSCSGQADCELKWGRAIAWVAGNSAFRVEVQTANLIQTAGPLPNRNELAIVINKIPVGGGGYRFELRGGCDNMFGCSPTLDYARAYFVREVMDGQTIAGWQTQ